MKAVDPEYGIDSRYKSRKEKGEESSNLLKARLERLKQLSKQDVERAAALQKRLKHEF